MLCLQSYLRKKFSADEGAVMYPPELYLEHHHAEAAERMSRAAARRASRRPRPPDRRSAGLRRLAAKGLIRLARRLAPETVPARPVRCR